MKTQTSTKLTRALAIGFLLAPALAQAHPGHASGLAAGVAHPLGGIDHLAAMIGVGLWAAQLGGRTRILLPVAFLAAMFVGGLVGTTGVAVPALEPIVVSSVFLLGLVIATARRLPLSAALGLVAAFAVFHGIAHGSEIPTHASYGTYAIGFLASTALLHAVGVGIGLIASTLNRPVWVRFAGTAIVLCGILSFTSWL